MTADQGTLFDGMPLGEGPKRRRAAGWEERNAPEFWRTEPGLWVVYHYRVSPKQGVWYEGWEFPVFWCTNGAWWAALDGDGSIPAWVLIWASREDAEHDLYLNYTKDQPLCPGRVSWPSRDNRRRRPVTT